MLRKFIAGALLGALLSGPVLAQSIQLGAGQVLGNSTAAQRPGRAENVTDILDRAMGSTRGSILERGASGWVIKTPGTAGLPWVSAGAGADPAYAILGLSGGGCNAALVASNGGVLYSTATACAVLSGTATARQMLQSGATAAPAWSTTTWPATTTINRLLWSSAANVISDLATANGGILNTSSGGVPSITPTPVLGVAGSVVGSIGFSNATSGVATLQPVTGALGTPTILIPAASGTLAVSGSAPITLNATTGALACATCVTSSGGGAITGTAPIAVSAAGVVSITSPLPVTNGGTSLASGTSGGVLCFNSASTIISSTALFANGVVIGGGAGSCPGSGASQVGTSGQVFLGVTAGAPQFATMSQDGTITNAGVLTITKTNNVAFGTAATVNTGTSGATIPLNNGNNTYSGSANFTSTFQIGGFTMTFPGAAATLTQTVASGTATMGTSAIASGACASVVTVAATGVATTDVMDVGFNGDPTATTGFIAPNMLSILPYPSAGNINIKECNNTASSITPAAHTLNWKVRK